MSAEVDLVAVDHGSVWLFTTTSDFGREWWEANVGESLTFGNAFAVERRYAHDIVLGAHADGCALRIDH
jgi:hypothetical protein